MGKIGIMGGTFDPPHIGHLAAAEEVRYRLGLDKILWIPAGIPPHKRDIQVTPPEHRLQMVRLAIEGNNLFELSDIEVKRPEVSYTVHTLETLKQLNPNDSLFFLLGTDEFSSLYRWYMPNKIVYLANLAVMKRAGMGPDIAKVESELPCIKNRYFLVDVPHIPISSTELRDRVRKGEPIRYLVPDKVMEYIYYHKLYVGCSNSGAL